MRQTLRLRPEENALIRAAAEDDSLSINSWAVRILLKAARAQLAAASTTTTTKPKPRKRVKIG